MRVSKRVTTCIEFVFLMLLASVVLSLNALAQTNPSPPEITVGSGGAYSATTSGFAVPALAGNVTALVVSEVMVTQFWQGYFGNVTGTITLDDGSNNTLFAWELVNPSGEVYAVNTTAAVQWTNLTCVNFTGNATNNATRINLSTLAIQFNMNNSISLDNLSKDAFNYTFNTTFSNNFVAGTRQITPADNCPQVYTFQDQAYQTSRFSEVLLHDNRSALVFATILENSINGFQAGANDLADFQMMVAEDGTPGKEAESTYYFYVELE